MDEIGHQNWAYRTEITSIVSACHAKTYPCVSISQAEKRITVMASIAADCSVLKLVIIFPRKTLDADLGAVTTAWIRAHAALRRVAGDNFPHSAHSTAHSI
jgi:hypothetical protein